MMAKRRRLLLSLGLMAVHEAEKRLFLRRLAAFLAVLWRRFPVV